MSPFDTEVLNQLNQGFLRLDKSLAVVYANTAILSMLDASQDDLLHLPFPRLTARSGIVFDPSVLQAESVHLLCLHSFTGRRLFLELSFSPLIDSQSDFMGYAVIVRDVSGKAERMERFAASMETYRDIASSCAHWFWETDTQGTFTFVSQEVTRHTGYTPEELFGRTPFEFMPEEEAERVASLFSNLSSRGLPFTNLLNKTITKDGRERVYSTNGVSVLDKNGNLKGYRGSNRDVTIEVESRRRLRGALEQTLEVLNELPVSVVVTDEDMNILQANRAACSMAGMSPKELCSNKSIHIFFSDREKNCLIDDLCKKTFSNVFNIAGKNGQQIQAMIRVTAVDGSAGKRYIYVITDLSGVENSIRVLQPQTGY